MTCLLIDIGNSTSKFTISRNGIIGEVLRYEGNNLIEFIDSRIGEKIENTVISSVTEIDPYFIEYLKLKSGKLTILNSGTAVPVKVLYNTPRTLGADRLAAVIGAYSMFRNENCIIFDFGTALTVDILNDRGEFVGGNISLGLRTRYAAISHYTEKLPRLDVPEIDVEKCDMLGKSTVTAIEYGILSSMLYEIEGYMEKYPDYKVIFTGGDAFYFADKMKKPIFVICNLVLVGLSYLAQYDSNEKGI